jgi:hypothetical protein
VSRRKQSPLKNRRSTFELYLKFAKALKPLLESPALSRRGLAGSVRAVWLARSAVLRVGADQGRSRRWGMREARESRCYPSSSESATAPSAAGRRGWGTAPDARNTGSNVPAPAESAVDTQADTQPQTVAERAAIHSPQTPANTALQQSRRGDLNPGPADYESVKGATACHGLPRRYLHKPLAHMDLSGYTWGMVCQAVSTKVEPQAEPEPTC